MKQLQKKPKGGQLGVKWTSLVGLSSGGETLANWCINGGQQEFSGKEANLSQAQKETFYIYLCVNFNIT